MFWVFYAFMLLLCMACMFAGWIWILIIAGREDGMCVVLCVFCPFYIFYYIFTRIEQTGIPAAMYFIPWLVIMGLVAVAAVVDAREQNQQVASSSADNSADQIYDIPQPDQESTPSEPSSESVPLADGPLPAENEHSSALPQPATGEVLVDAAAPLPETPLPATPLPAASDTTFTPTPATPAEPTFAPGLKGEAQRAYHEGRFTDGNSFLQAALLASDDKSLWDHVRWCPALGRPLPGIRWGIGIQLADNVPMRTPQGGDQAQAGVVDPDNGLAQPASGDGDAGVDDTPAELRQLTGDLGDKILAAVPASQRQALLGAPGDAPKSLKGVQYVGKGADLREVISLARQRGVDVLVLAAIAIKVQGNNRAIDATLAIRLVDVSTEKRLWSSQTLSSNQVKLALGRRQDLGGEMVAILSEYLQTNLQMRARPPLDKDAVRQRAEALAREEPVNPLPALMEVRYYQRLGLMTPLQAELCYGRLIDPNVAEKMATGSEEERLRILDRYLPRSPRN